jgi:hypothetical protein
MQKERATGRPLSEFDELLAELHTRDPEFAARVDEYYKPLENADFIEAAIEYLWDQARRHGHTVAQELEYILGGGHPDSINEYRIPPGRLDPMEEFAAFREALKDPRTFIDLALSHEGHGSHIHAFQEFLGDRLWGRGKGREFRQKLAEVEGTSRTVDVGARTFEKPFWSRLWDAMFDADSPDLHSPEVLGWILQHLADFPRFRGVPPGPAP